MADTFTSQHDALVAFHSRLLGPDINPNLATGNVAVSRLGTLGVGAIFIPKGGYRDEEVNLGVEAHTAKIGDDGLIELSEKTSQYSVGPTAEVRAVRARTTREQPGYLERVVPVVNGPSLAAIGRSKWTQYELCSSFMATTVFVEPDSHLNPDDLDKLEGDKVVVKGNNSQAGNAIAVVSKDKQAIDQAISDMRDRRAGKGKSDAGWIVQEFDPAAPFPGMESTIEEGERLLERVGGEANPELRMWCFADKRTTLSSKAFLRPYAMGRVYPGRAGDSWLPVDQFSLPDAAFNIAAKVVEKVLKHTGSLGGLAVVDLYRSAKTGVIRVRELNLGDPALGGMLSSPSLSEGGQRRVVEIARKEHGNRLGDLLAALALNRRTTP